MYSKKKHLLVCYWTIDNLNNWTFIMKKLLIVVAGLAAFASLPAQAQCTGTGNFKTCFDNNGNTYSVSKIGNHTSIQGSNSATGSHWSQTSNTIGNTTYQNGTAANGNTWNGTTTVIGNTTYHNGVDSDGNSYNKACTKFGCN